MIRELWLVASRDAIERARSKAFIISTVITFLVVIILGSVAYMMSTSGPEELDIAVTGPLPVAFELTLAESAAELGADVTTTPVANEAEARALVEAEDVDAALVGPHTIIVESDRGTLAETVLDAALRRAQFLEGLDEAGLSADQIGRLLAGGVVEVETVNPEPDPSGELVGFIAVVLLFAAITMYGNWVMMGVLEEKTTNVAEQLVTSISVRTLLAGKVIGIGALGLAQLTVLISAGLVLANVLTDVSLPETAAAAAVWAFAWFILGFAFYAVLYAATGSLVSRVEDAQAASTPVVMISLAAYFGTFALVMSDPGSTVSRILSLLPPMAPIAFPARMAVTGVPLWESLLGVAIMVLAVIGTTRLAARIYAGALLTGGARVKLRQAWRASGELAGGG